VLYFFAPTRDRSSLSLVAPSGAQVPLAAPSSPFACGDLSAPSVPDPPAASSQGFDAPPDKVAYLEARRRLAAGQKGDAERELLAVVERFPDSPYATLAKEQLEPLQPRPRRGFTFGLALTGGFGFMSLEEPVAIEEQGFVLQGDFRGGWMLTPNLALLLGLSSAVLPTITPTPNIAAFDASAQWFLADELWVRGGAGLGVAGQSGGSSDSEFEDVEFEATTDPPDPSRGLSLRLGLGYELIHIQNPRRNHALSAELGMILLPAPGNTALAASAGFGYQWY
jgi:hypothetical protein